MYLFVGLHAEYLENGCQLLPGETVDDVSPDEPLLKRELLVPFNVTPEPSNPSPPVAVTQEESK